MGVTFSSRAMTVATTSVREDMAIALVKTFGQHFDQVLIVSDPLFVRRLLDCADEQGVDWSRYRVRLVLGEELFGERFRSATSRAGSGLNLDGPDAGQHHLVLRRGRARPSPLLRDARDDCAQAGRDEAPGARQRALRRARAVLSMILAYSPQRTLIEAVDPDPSGYGRLTVSMLDTALPIPLLRYQTGDVVRLLEPGLLSRLVRDAGLTLADPLPEAMLVLRGRDKDRLPDGSYVAAYKDALYADPAVADRLSGAFRLTVAGAGLRVEVQLARGARADVTFADRLRNALRVSHSDVEVSLSPYEAFPYGSDWTTNGSSPTTSVSRTSSRCRRGTLWPFRGMVSCRCWSDAGSSVRDVEQVAHGAEDLPGTSDRLGKRQVRL